MAKSDTLALERLKDALKSGDIGRLYVFHGEEAYLRRYYLEELKKCLVPEGFAAFNFHHMEGRGLSMQQLADAVEAMPMMAEHTLIIVSDLDLYKLDERSRAQVIELLEDLPAYCTLVFSYEQIPFKRDAKMKKLTAALARAEVVEFAQQERHQLLRWIKKRFAALGHDIDAVAADHLLFTCGTLMSDLIPEMEKIGAYAKGKSVTVSDINAVAEPVLDARIFDMTNCITAGKQDDAARVLGELLRMQTEPIVILASVGKELRRLYTARLALSGGKDRYWLKELWGMSSDYPAKLLMQAAQRVSAAWCREALKRCQMLDRRMKSERNIDAEAEVKQFVMELAVR